MELCNTHVRVDRRPDVALARRAPASAAHRHTCTATGAVRCLVKSRMLRLACTVSLNRIRIQKAIAMQCASNQSRECIVRIDGIAMLIFDMYNVLSAGGYLAKKIGSTLFHTLRV